MSNNELKEFMTNKETIDKHKIKKIIGKSNGKTFLAFSGTSELGSSLYVLFMPETFLFFQDESLSKKVTKISAHNSLRPNFA